MIYYKKTLSSSGPKLTAVQKQRQYMTDQYMDMQQNMMNQMMQQNYMWINPER